MHGINLISRDADGSKVYYLYNGHHDVVQLMTEGGVMVASYYYDAFGVIVEETGDADNPYRYGGYFYDPETLLYYLKSRFYDPGLARFMQEDTYYGNRADPLSLNLYTYCANNPIIYWDPTGHWKDGDETYSPEVQLQLAKLTSDYYIAQSKGNAVGMAAASKAADKLRDTNKTSNSNITDAGLEYTKSVRTNGAFTVDSWTAIVAYQAS